jgi:HPt (histidine-containing phosphotransfer) domain-containing protein
MTEAIIDPGTFDALKTMTGADFLPVLIDTYFSDSAELLTEIRSALDSGDSQRFGRAAHSFKGNSATFGAMSLAALARELELMGKNNNLDGAVEKLDALQANYRQVQAALEALRDDL